MRLNKFFLESSTRLKRRYDSDALSTILFKSMRNHQKALPELCCWTPLSKQSGRSEKISASKRVPRAKKTLVTPHRTSIFSTTEILPNLVMLWEIIKIITSFALGLAEVTGSQFPRLLALGVTVIFISNVLFVYFDILNMISYIRYDSFNLGILVRDKTLNTTPCGITNKQTD